MVNDVLHMKYKVQTKVVARQVSLWVIFCRLLTYMGSLHSNTWEWTPAGKVDLALDYLYYFPKQALDYTAPVGHSLTYCPPSWWETGQSPNAKWTSEPLQRLGPYLPPPFMSYLFKGHDVCSSDSSSVFLGIISCKMLFENKKNVLQKFVKCCLV